jgi:hypothetical protein
MMHFGSDTVDSNNDRSTVKDTHILNHTSQIKESFFEQFKFLNLLVHLTKATQLLLSRRSIALGILEVAFVAHQKTLFPV